MTLLNRIEQTGKLWAIMLPHVPAPEPAWFGRWCAHSDEIVEHAIIRASKKFSRDTVPAPISETVWRYVSGVVTNEAQRQAVRTISLSEESV